MTLEGSRIAPCLWFDSEAEAAARFYTSIFPNSSIGPTSTYGKEGDPAAQQCGWLKDRFGVSWQVVPVQMQELLDEGDPVRKGRVMEALLAMKKLDIAGLQRAYDGVDPASPGPG